MRKAHIILRNMRLGTTVFTDLTAEKFQLQTLHIADILRTVYSEDSSLAVRLKSFTDSGELVPDDLITELIERELAAFPGDFQLLDYPRSMNQFLELQKVFEKTGIMLETLWVLELKDIEPLVVSQQKFAELNGFQHKFASESEEMLRNRFQHANAVNEWIKQGLDKDVTVKIIRYDHPLESQMEEIRMQL